MPGIFSPSPQADLSLVHSLSLFGHWHTETDILTICFPKNSRESTNTQRLEEEGWYGAVESAHQSMVDARQLVGSCPRHHLFLIFHIISMVSHSLTIRDSFKFTIDAMTREDKTYIPAWPQKLTSHLIHVPVQVARESWLDYWLLSFLPGGWGGENARVIAHKLATR